MKFRKKAVVIEAFHFSGTNYHAVKEFCAHALIKYTAGLPDKLVIPTLEGEMLVSPGDWVIRGVAGEYYPIKPDILEATYERAE